MKKIILIGMLVSLSPFVMGQRFFGRTSIAPSVSTMKVDDNLVLNYNLEVEKILGRTFGSIRGDISFAQFEYEINDFSMDIMQFNLNLAYSYMLAELVNKRLLLHSGAGFSLGIESVGKDNYNAGLVFHKNETFIYGLFGFFRTEYMISRDFSIFAEPLISYNFQTVAEKFSYGGKFGVKLYL